MLIRCTCNRNALAYLGILLGAFLVTGLLYFPARSAWFMLEDLLWLEPVAPGKLLAFFHSSWGFCNLYRPLMRVSFYIDLNLFGENPLGWHVHSWLLHAANGAWLFLILRRLHAGRALSVIACLLFITSPVARENLTWISARTGLLCAFFYLGAFYATVLACDGGLRRRWLLPAAVLFLAALATYEAAFSFPAAVALFLFAPRREPPLPLRQRLGVLALFAAELALALAARYVILGGSVGQVDMAHAGYLRGLLMNLRSILDVAALNFPEELIFALPVIGAGLLLGHRQRWGELGQGLALVLAAAALYLPFSGTVGMPLRFLYMAQVPYWVLVAGAWTLIGRYGPRWKPVILLVLALQVGCHAVRCFTYADQYRRAADLAKSIPEQVKALHPEPPAGMNFVFHNIPLRQGDIPVFTVGFEAAIRREYGRFDGRVIRADEWLSAPDLREAPARYFYYRDADRRVVELSRAEWEQLNLKRAFTLRNAQNTQKQRSEYLIFSRFSRIL